MVATETEETNQENDNGNVNHENPKKGDAKSSPKIDTAYSKKSEKGVNMFLVICVIGVTLGILLEVIKVRNINRNVKDEIERRKYWVYSAKNNVTHLNGVLKHVHLVLDRLDYELSTNNTDWNLLWSHDYPFRTLFPHMHRLKPHQRVNHIPGIGHITNKVDLATTDSKYIPKAFRLPENKEEFLKYASENKNALFMQKLNQHRGVYLKNVSDIDLVSGKSFVQECVQKPFLVDGHKFDIGVYVVVTSVNPLRAYWYKGDVLFRFCRTKYYPLDAKVLDKYVIADDYLPTWEVPSLSHPYVSLGSSMKDAFDLYAQSKGKDTDKMWTEVQKAIAEILEKKEHMIIGALKDYPSKDNFFEMMRFDLVLDEDLNVFLLEANMSPNLSSAHFKQNELLYEQVLYSLFGITMQNYHSSDQKCRDMISTQKNIAVWGEQCSTTCKTDCDADVCGVCRHCLDAGLRSSLLAAHREFLNRRDFRRLYPPPMKQRSLDDIELKNMTKYNKLQHLWYQGKCNLDVTWCT